MNVKRYIWRVSLKSAKDGNIVFLFSKWKWLVLLKTDFFLLGEDYRYSMVDCERILENENNYLI